MRTLAAADPAHFADQRGTVAAGPMDAVGVALRAVLDLRLPPRWFYR